MSLTLSAVDRRAQRAAFLALPYRLHRDDLHWVPPLREQVRQSLSPRHNPFFEHGEAQLFVAERDGRCVGRISAHLDADHDERHGPGTAFFGFFECERDPAVARALVDAARRWAQDRGRVRLRGPLSFTINDEVGVLVDGFDTPPYMLMAHNPPYYDALLREAGMEPIKELLAWTYDPTRPVPPKMREGAALVEAVPGLTLRPIDKRRLGDEVRMVMRVFNEAWRDNWGFVPMTQAGLAKLASELKLLLLPELTVVAEYRGEPVAIAIALPDLNAMIADLGGRLLPWGLPKLLWRMVRGRPRRVRLALLGLTPAARGGELWGLSLALYTRLHDAAQRLGVEHAELSWTLDDNRKVNRGIERMGGRVYKRYRVYETAL